MASIRGFEVTVEEADGTPFQMYGTRKRGSIMYTSIEAKDGVRFNVRIRPANPFPEPADANIDGSRKRYTLRSSSRDAVEDAMDCDESVLKPKRGYDFFGYVYIDGNYKADDSVLIATEPGAEFYSSKGQVFEGRCCDAPEDDDASSDGDVESDSRHSFHILPWIMRDKGVDVWLGNMDLSKDNAEVATTDHDKQMADIEEAIADDSLSESANRKRGHIEIVIRRETELSAIRRKKRSKSSVREDLGDDAGSTHEIIVDENNKQHCRSEVVRTRRFREDEEFYCKIDIAYHDLAKLKNLGLANRDGSATSRQQQRILASSSSPESQTPVLKRLRDLDLKSDNTISDANSSDEESGSSDESSDSDAPRPHKRRAIPGIRKTKRRSKTKTSSWGAQAAEPAKQSMAAIESSNMSLAEFNFDLKDELSQQVQLELQETGNQLLLAIEDAKTGTDGSGGNEVVVVNDEVVEMTEDIS
ncbi:hypothetical protein H2200_011490 [Cladophialophora chaetospira]|uniref:Uncharacterized protein n=1 Tax=Cladophialophora chaetospira TaxID=386627 RepID=A0AA39CD65_9EURO|nr:hypothetical protein H2200_011490 [Cladophialophora chaetospira]